MNEHWEELREKVRDEFRFKREAVREYFHDTLHNLEAKVVAHIHNAEGRGAAAEETLKCRLEAVEGRIQLIEDRLTTHVDTRLAKVERDASTNRVDTGVAPPYSNAQSQRVEQGR